VKQLNLQGRTKEQKAIEFIQEHEPPEGYFGGFSGGKDSVVLKNITVKSNVKCEWYYSSTGLDAPELSKFIKRYHPDVTWLKPKESFFKIIVKNGFPTIFRRWCCDVLKKNPSSYIKLNHRLMGIRAEESLRRAKRGQINYHKKYWLYKPLFYWLEWEIWEHIDSNNLAYCSLYDEGFTRLGCVVCPFLSGYKNQRKFREYKARWPKIYAAFERAMADLYYDTPEWWRQMKKRHVILFDEFLDAWYKGK